MSDSEATGLPPGDLLALMDWKRRVLEVYRDVREASDPRAAWQRWRRARDELFSSHPQSPVPSEQRASFAGLSYFDYDASARVSGRVREAAPERLSIASSGEAPVTFIRFATVSFELRGRPLTLELYWLDSYAGGLFLPFADDTRGRETYGAGRYLLDSAKGADLGGRGDQLTLDFNFAYNPSCAYDPRWVCPLAPPANRLPIAIQAGERAPA